jgi:putative nucleotidyltransferase with HDIG domain
MKIDTTFLRSKVARRIFLQFILCALLPFGVLAVFSMREVTQQLTKESEARLLQSTRAQGMSVYERLTLLEAEMKLIAAGRRSRADASLPAMEPILPQEMKDRFAGMEEAEPSGAAHTLFGDISVVPELSNREASWIQQGHTAISVHPGPNHSRIYMVRALDSHHPERGRLVAEINLHSLFGVAALPAHTDLCVLDASNRAIFCSAGNLPATSRQGDPKQGAILPDLLRGGKEDSYITMQWEIFLKPQFGIPKWTMVLGEPRSEVLAVLVHFKKTFPQVILLSIWLVTLLSLIQIRRSLVPLERLQEATQRMSGFNFGTPVNVTSGDEFQDLAHSFNSMADRLSRQFHLLESINQIDRAVLSSLETDTIVRTVLRRMQQIVAFDCVSISVLGSGDSGTYRSYLSCVGNEFERLVGTGRLTAEERQQLCSSPEVIFLDVRSDLPGYLAAMNLRGMKFFMVLPLIHQQKVLGTIGLGHSVLLPRSDEDVFRARQVADQVAVALSNAALIKELADLHIGTLTALARAIDAKSGWTSGHSERVTDLAVNIGRRLGLPTKDLETLHRGGLLHDIGKIGIPAAILDKPGKLNAEELQLMREHVRIGARILEPIPGFEDVLPIVLQHHEWYDGSGYPDRLAGESISLHARIFALADCYDALISARPYRPALDHTQVMEMIWKESGTHFDPEVVEAFHRLMSEEILPEESGEIMPVGVAPGGWALG